MRKSAPSSTKRRPVALTRMPHGIAVLLEVVADREVAELRRVVVPLHRVRARPVAEARRADGERHVDAVAGVVGRAAHFRELPAGPEIARAHLGVGFEAAAGDHHGLAGDVLEVAVGFHLQARDGLAVVDQRDAARVVADLDAVLLGELEVLVDQPRAAALGFHREAAPELEFAVDEIGLAAPDRVELHALAVQPAHRVARAADEAVAQLAVGAVLRHPEHVVVELVLGVGTEVGAVDLVLGQVRHDRLEIVDAVVDAAEGAGGEAGVAAHQLLRRALDHRAPWSPSRPPPAPRRTRHCPRRPPPHRTLPRRSSTPIAALPH